MTPILFQNWHSLGFTSAHTLKSPSWLQMWHIWLQEWVIIVGSLWCSAPFSLRRHGNWQMFGRKPLASGQAEWAQGETVRETGSENVCVHVRQAENAYEREKSCVQECTNKKRTGGRSCSLAMVQSGHTVGIEASGRTKLCVTPPPPLPPLLLGSHHIFPAALALAAGRPFPAGLQRGLVWGGGEGRWGEPKGKRKPCCFSLVSSLRPQWHHRSSDSRCEASKSVFPPEFIWLGRPFYKRWSARS